MASAVRVFVSYTDLELNQQTVSTPNILEDPPAVPDLGRPAEEGLAPPKQPVNQLTVADNIQVSYENSGQVNTTGTWAKSVSIGAPVPYSIAYKLNGEAFLFSSSYSPRTVSVSGFSENGLLKETVTESKKPYGAAAGSYATELISAGSELPPGDVSTFTQETYSYNKNGKVIRRDSIEYISLPEFAGSFPIDFERDDGFVIVSGAGYAKKASSVTTYSYAASYVRRATDRYVNYALTQHGQQTIRASNNLISTTNEVIALFSSLVDSLVFQASEVQVDSSSRVRERASGVFPSSLADPTNGETNDFEARSVPPMPELTIEAYGERNEEIVSGPAGRRQQIVEVDVNFGSDGLESDGVIGSGLEEIITYSLPYSPDDYYVPAGGGFASAVSSNAGANAYNYGKVQYRLELGTRKGLSLQVPVEQMPLSPFDPFYLQLDNVTGQYRANGMSWTMDRNGIVGQIDAVFWQGTGQTGTPGPIWFPTPPGVSTLPTTPNSVVNASPAPANIALLPVDWDPAAPDLTTLFEGLPTGVPPVYPTVLDAPAGLNPFTEIVPLLAITRSVLSVVSVPYSLVPQSATADMVTHSPFVGLQVVLVEAPVTSLTLAAFAPAVYVTVSVPLTTLTLTSFAPVIYTSITVEVPLTTLTLTAFAPTLNLLSVPATALTLASFAPTVTSAATDPNFANVSVLLHMNGTNGSTTITDSSSNGITVTAYGNAQISTAQSKFGGASAYFDGTGDYMMTASSLTPLNMGTGDFTVEAFIRPTNSVSGFKGLIGLEASDVDTLYISTGQIRWYISGAAAGTIAVDQWYHVAASRQGSTLRVFIDGTLVNTSTNSNNITLGRLRMGSNGGNTGEWFFGWMDEVRITKGVARYTASFTAPTEPFPDA